MSFEFTHRALYQVGDHSKLKTENSTLCALFRATRDGYRCILAMKSNGFSV